MIFKKNPFFSSEAISKLLEIVKAPSSSSGIAPGNSTYS